MRFRRPTILTGAALGSTAAVITGSAGFLVGRYPAIPPIVTVHFDRVGRPDRWAVKSYALLLVPVWIQLVLLAACGAIAAILLWRRTTSPDQGPQRLDDGDDAMRMLLMAEAVMMLLLVWVSFQAYLAWQIVGIWESGWPGVEFLYAAVLLVAITISIMIVIRAMAKVGRPLARSAADGRHWRLKVLYFNPDDPALFVADRRGVGYTLNFGRPAAIWLLAGVLVLALGAPFALMRFFYR
jgi:uncharacterized membrane protein